ncbi:MAG: hypothetical protein M1334_02130 [Patescibacteria group bacterium]|nr:hypothetical protein [Patescibacteria group bacterium]
MEIIPAINSLDIEGVEDNLKIVRRLGGFFLKRPKWVHLDYADSRYTFNKTWGSPDEFPKLSRKYGDLKWEVHLMVLEPEKIIESYFKAGVKRVIIQAETINNFYFLIEAAAKHNVELMFSVSPDVPVESLRPYMAKINEFQVLAVHPGLAGQKFLPLNLDKIKYIRSHLPDAKIEVDGGVNLEIAKITKAAGADIAVSASYIFNNRNPKKAYRDLIKV